VNDLSDQYYSEPSRFHGKVKVAVHPEWAAAGCDSMKAKPVSPAENIMSYILYLDKIWNKGIKSFAPLQLQSFISLLSY
jgi:hypothetical protein